MPNRPKIAEGKDVGAHDDYGATDYYSTLNDIRDYGAAMDGSTDDSGAIYDAMADSTGNGEAAYIPSDAGTVAVRSRVMLDESENGAALVGDGYDSLIEQVEDTGHSFFNVSNNQNAPLDLHFANFQYDGANITGGGNHYGFWVSDGGQDGDDPVDDNEILLENLWVANCSENVRMDKAGGVVRDCSLWGAHQWHGVAGNNYGQTPRPRFENLLAWDNAMYGIDLSSGDLVADTAICYNNEYGMKVSADAGDIDITNVHAEDNDLRAFNMTPTSTSPQLSIHNFVAIDNNSGDEPGLVFAYGPTVDGGNLYVSGDDNHGIRVHGDDTTIDIDYIEACNNSICGFHCVDSGVSGGIGTIRGEGNGDGLVGSSANVSIDTVSSGSCDFPDVIPDYEPVDSDDELIAFVTNADAPGDTEYEMVCQEEPDMIEDVVYDTECGNPVRASPPHIEITQLDDGRWLVDGFTGECYGDAFNTNGPVDFIWIEDEDVMWAEHDGERKTPEGIVADTDGEWNPPDSPMGIRSTSETGLSETTPSGLY